MKRLLAVLLVFVALTTPSVRAQNGSFEAEQTYLTQMGIVANMATEAFQYGADTTDTADTTDPVWVAQFASVWAIFEVIQRTLDAVDVPATFAGSFGYFKISIDVMANNADYCRAGFVALDTTILNACTEFITQSSQLIDLARTTMGTEAAALGISVNP